MSAIYYYGQDGEIADDELIKLFDLSTKEIRHSDKLNANVYDFVGFVYKDDKILVMFPKHYYEKADIDAFNRTNVNLGSDIKLLYNVLKRYGENEKSTATVSSHLGAMDGYSSDYLFKPFYEVYNYYQKYGIYKEKETRVVKGATGKISWKDTLRKSNIIIDNGNLILVPLYVNKKNFNEVFLTECMAFIIDYTIDFFNAFLSMKKKGVKCRFEFFSNIDYVLIQLKTSQSTAFKDSQKQLIQNMIDYFEQLKSKAKGGKIHIRIRYFNNIWQAMVNQYLNRYFSGINTEEKSAVFDLSRTTSVSTFKESSFDVDASQHGYKIRVDHIAQRGNDLYIFDSKYYKVLDDLEYKQFAYGELLREYYPSITARYNILLLPGRSRADIHFSLAPLFIGKERPYVEIIEQYLEPKTVMQEYLKKL